MRKPRLIDEEVAWAAKMSMGIDGGWFVAKSDEGYTLAERIYHAWLVLTEQARAFRYKQDDIKPAPSGDSRD